ncbi:MAG: fibronectin type III domain-containing protein [Bacteroidales bacterium]|nr:fibronectin type III domain-containing protein [Bacteroidales bacterium]
MRLVLTIFLLVGYIAIIAQGDQPNEVLLKDKEAGISVTSDAFRMIFEQNLENTKLGPYTRETWAADWNNPPWANGAYTGDRTVITDYNLGGRSSRGMKWTFPEGTFSADGNHGYQWRSPLGGIFYECYLTYSILFKPGFEPVLGGKLPGLQASPIGGVPDSSEGFGGSLMFKEGPKPVFYTYHHDMPGAYGHTRGWDYNFDVSTDIWYDITYRVVMNSITDESIVNYDGIMEGYVNGELVGQWTGLRLRILPTLGLDVVRIQAFFGGGDDSWATIRDEWMIIDNVYVWNYSDQYLSENPSVKRGNQAGSYGDRIETPIDLLAQPPDPDPDPTEPDTQPPTVPTGLYATDSSQTTISFAWNAATDNVAVTGYTVYKDNFPHGVTGSNTYTVTNLAASTQYTFSVSAKDAADNESPKSSAIYVYTRNKDTESPTAPSNLRAVRITGNSIEINWDPSIDNVAVKNYSIYLNGDNDPAGSTGNTVFIIPGLTPNTPYTISVRAFDTSDNPSPLSNEISETTGAPDNEPPSAPTSLRATEVTEKTISLEWNPSTDNVAVNAYEISVNNSDQKSFSNQYTIGNLEPGLYYRITVSALDEASNESPESEALDVTTKNEDLTTDPTLPTIAILTVQDKTIQPNSTTEMKSLGFAEVMNYGLEVTELDNPLSEPIVLPGLKTSSVLSRGRVTENLQVLYNFSNGEGSEVSDISGVGEPMTLHISREGVTTEWIKGQGLRVTESTIISNKGIATKLMEALPETNEITLEAWVKQEDRVQSGPARIITLSADHFNRAVMLAHEGNESAYKYVARLNTTGTDANGIPEIASDIDFTSMSLHHVVYTHDNDGMERLYINGQEFYSGTREGDFSSWDDDYQFALANEITGERPWTGIFYLAAVYNRALSESEVDQNYKSGFGQIQFTTDLDTLESNVSYKLSPFVRTSQGIVIGDAKDFIYKNVALTDSLLSFYPNPNSGEFTVIIKNRDENVKVAYLRIADFAGQVHYNSEIDLSEGLLENNIEVQLPAMTRSGFYSIILIAGAKSVAEKLVLIR